MMTKSASRNPAVAVEGVAFPSSLGLGIQVFSGQELAPDASAFRCVKIKTRSSRSYRPNAARAPKGSFCRHRDTPHNHLSQFPAAPLPRSSAFDPAHNSRETLSVFANRRHYAAPPAQVVVL